MNRHPTKLKRNQRIVAMRIVYRYTLRQIAEEFNLSISSVRTVLDRYSHRIQERRWEHLFGVPDEDRK